MTDTASTIAKLRRLADEATPGPWIKIERAQWPREIRTAAETDDRFPHRPRFGFRRTMFLLAVDGIAHDWGDGESLCTHTDAHADFDFVCAARDMLPKLLDVAEAAAALAARVRTVVKHANQGQTVEVWEIEDEDMDALLDGAKGTDAKLAALEEDDDA